MQILLPLAYLITLLFYGVPVKVIFITTLAITSYAVIRNLSDYYYEGDYEINSEDGTNS